MGILERLALPARHRDQSLSINDWADYFTFGGNTYPVVQTTMGTVDREQVGFTSVAGFKGSGPIFSLVLARLQVFSQVRFQWTRFAGSQPTELFGTSELGVLERPWRGGTTSDLLARMEVHASVAGCAYVTRPRADRLSLLRPDRVIIVMGSETDAEDPSEAPDAEIIGFVHETSRGKMTFFDPDQIAYYSPIPDPDYRFLGMSWITPVIRDLQADSLATEHKARYFCNAATPNLAIKFDASIAIEKVRQFKELFESEHKGALNAWKTVFLGGGADPVTVGNSFKEMDYAVIQGRAESRLASAAGVPPSWVGFAEGLSGSSLNAGNFNSARRRFSDGTMIHLWGSAATSLEVLLNRPQGATLWYDPRVPFMREDAGDLAAIQQNQAQTIVALVRDGFTPESAVAAVTKNDFSLLVHSGKVSVQLQEPGTNPGFGEQVPKASAPDGARSQERHTPGGNPHNQQDHAGGGTVGLAKKAVKAITPGFKLPQGIPQKDYDRLVRIRTYGYDSTEADESWADSLDWPAWVKERAEGEASLLTKEQWYRESLPGELKDMPIGQLRERMAEHLHKTWAGKPIAVRAFPEDLEAILKDGRFKTQFETGKAGREASFMPARRKDLEAALHGIPHDSDPSKRPVYGYVSMDPDTPWEDKQLNKFGPIAVMLKDSVRSRTTATVGDSANEDYSVWPSPVDNPSSVSANPVIVRNSIRRFPTALDDGRGRDTLHPEFRANEYVEAQIHDGVTVDDIVEVVFLVEPSDALKGQLKRAGIPWKVSTPPTSGNAVRAVILTDEWDDDPIGELDDDTLILLQAMAELEEEAGLQSSRAWNPALHPRWPKGHPKAGQFRTMIDQLKAAIKAFDPAKDKHPFEHFKRPQLLKAAKARGIAVKRGESDDSLKAKLLADLGGKPAAQKPATAPSGAPVPTPPAAGVTTKPGSKFVNGDPTTEVHLGSDQLGIVVHSSKTGGFFPFVPGGSKKSPLGNMIRVQPGAGSGYQTEQSAVDAIVKAHTPSKVTGPGLAGLNLTELRIEPVPDFPGSRHMSKTSHEIMQGGKPIGSVHDFGYSWEARDAQGKTVGIPQGGFFANKTQFKNKSEALDALVSQAGTPATPKTPAAAVNTAAQQNSKHGPEIQAALDILYGKDPKGHTMVRQLAVYGALRRNQFDQLGPREQSTVLGDLSFIAATSKGKSAADAANLVHRFTPPGTTTGTVHKQAIHLPPSVTAAQTRVADPNGTPGLLKVRDPKDRGVSGDGWTRLPNGGTGPWGQYGAAGVMLRHVDPADGKERFLMIERGPGISDPGKWQFPGGAIDSKESPHEGAARETVEELGFKAKDMLDARVHGTHEVSIPNSTWKYTSIAATVDKQLKPDLSTHHARMETADAKWMTRDEIKALDAKGKLLKPLAGGQLETNVMTLFPSKATPAAAGTPGQRPPRLTGTPTVAPPTVVTHKPSTGKDLFPDKASKDTLRQQIKQDRKKFAGKAADDRLAAIGAMQGFDDVPTVVSKAEMDRLLKTGDYIEAFRGVSGAGSGWRGPTRGGQVSRSKTAADINEEFRSGPAYYGNGIYGNGYYFATLKSVASGYSDHSKGSVVRVLIPKKAKIVNHAVVLRESRAASSPLSKAKGVHESGTLYDEGRYAAARGYDMIEIDTGAPGSSHVAKPGKPAYNILNRSVLIVEEA